jgi:hypothetical protein
MDSESQRPKHVLDYASRRSRGEPISWVGVGVATVLLLLVGAFLVEVVTTPRHVHRPQCGTNEHQILTAIYDYAQRNGGNLPPSLQALQGRAGSTSSSYLQIFHCPAGPGGYIYVGAGMNLSTTAKGTILIYEPPTNHKDPKTGKGEMNVGYVDGAVRTIVQPQADKIIAELKAGHNPPREEMIQ